MMVRVLKNKKKNFKKAMAKTGRLYLLCAYSSLAGPAPSLLHQNTAFIACDKAA